MFQYLISRYGLASVLCCRRSRGQIEKFKEKALAKMLGDPARKHVFKRYVLGDLPIKHKRVRRYIREYENELNKRKIELKDEACVKFVKVENKLADGKEDDNKSKKNSIFPKLDEQTNLFNKKRKMGKRHNSGSRVHNEGDANSKDDDLPINFEGMSKRKIDKVFENFEKVEPSSDYGDHKATSLGLNRKLNIQRRLREGKDFHFDSHFFPKA